MAGAVGGGFQQIAELAQHMRADGVALIARDQVSVRALVEIHVEVVVPEIHQLFLKLAIAFNRAIELALRQSLPRLGKGRRSRAFQDSPHVRVHQRQQSLADGRHDREHLRGILLWKRGQEIQSLLVRSGAQ